MEDRFRQSSLRFGIPVLGIIVVAILVFRAAAGAALRMLGLWAYLAAVNREWPDGKLVQEAQRASSGIDILVPYWGSQRRLDEESVERELAPVGARA